MIYSKNTPENFNLNEKQRKEFCNPIFTTVSYQPKFALKLDGNTLTAQMHSRTELAAPIMRRSQTVNAEQSNISQSLLFQKNKTILISYGNTSRL